MSSPYQECALYGELVLHLRDRAAELLARANPQLTAAEATKQLDEVIRAWFFAPQKDMMGCASRDLIWAEQMDKPNPVPADHLQEMFDCDCPICQEMLKDAEADIATGREHGWQWHYDDGGCPLISIYDPEGWDARWAKEDAEFAQWRAEHASDLKEDDAATTPEEFLGKWRELRDESSDAHGAEWN